MSTWFYFFSLDMHFDKQKSTLLAEQHANIDFNQFRRWFYFFLLDAHLPQQESLDLAKEHVNKNLDLFKKWYLYCVLDVKLTAKEAIKRAFQSMYLDLNLDKVKSVKILIILNTDYNEAKSASLAMDEQYYSIDIEKTKKLMKFFYSKTNWNKSISFELALECINFDFDELERKLNGAKTLTATRKIVEEIKSEYLARELAKVQVSQDTYRSGTKVEAFWEDRRYPKWNGWYAATIVAKQGTAWLVRYDKYPRWGDCSTKAENVRFPVGASVQAFWKDSMYEGWFPAVVTSQNADGYSVMYKDYPQWGDCATKKHNVRN